MLGRLAVLYSVISLSTGCAEVFLQTDGYPAALEKGCRTELECDKLVIEAKRRVATCQDNTVGFIRCDNAHADLEAALAIQARYVTARNRFAAEQEEKAKASDAEADKWEATVRAEKKAAAEKKLAREKAKAEHDQAVAVVAKLKPLADKCAATTDARALRATHEEQLKTSAVFLQQSCTAKHGVVMMKYECTDANGFKRTCTKPVTGGVTGYQCPKGTDPDVVKAGHYALGFTTTFPFPDDEKIEVTDETCGKVEAIMKKAAAGPGKDDFGSEESK